MLMCNAKGCADGFGSILCGDLAIKQIEEPFVTDDDDGREWAI